MSKEFAAKPKRFAGAAGGFGPKKSFGDRPSYGAPRTGGYGAARPSFGGPRKSFGGPRPAFGGGYGSQEERPSFEAVCDGCQKDCRVPFRPNGSKPVLCTNCFRKERDAEGGSDRPAFAGREERPYRSTPRAPFGAPAARTAPADDTRMKAIEAKLDRILKLLGGEEEKA